MIVILGRDRQHPGVERVSSSEASDVYKGQAQIIIGKNERNSTTTMEVIAHHAHSYLDVDWVCEESQMTTLTISDNMCTGELEVCASHGQETENSKVYIEVGIQRLHDRFAPYYKRFGGKNQVKDKVAI